MFSYTKPLSSRKRIAMQCYAMQHSSPKYLPGHFGTKRAFSFFCFDGIEGLERSLSLFLNPGIPKMSLSAVNK